MLSGALRKISSFRQNTGSFFRKLRIRLLYPSAKINSGTFIGRNCSISCSNDSKLSLLNTYVSNGTVIKADNGSALTISDCFIGYNCVIVSMRSIEIRPGCLIAEMVVIRDQDHVRTSGVPFCKSGLESEKILIHENVWLGSKATVLKGTEIKTGAVVGANSLAKGILEANTVYGGIPARIISGY
jgi:hypothetical protein